jgi:hypothetical protein
MSSRPTPWAPARRFSSVTAWYGVTVSPSMATGRPASNVTVTSSGSRGTPGSDV